MQIIAWTTTATNCVDPLMYTSSVVDVVSVVVVLEELEEVLVVDEDEEEVSSEISVAVSVSEASVPEAELVTCVVVKSGES